MSKNRNTIADEIVQGLTEFAEALEAGTDLGERFTCHRVVLDLRPEPYSAEKVKATRKILRASQTLFAKFLGASVKTVRHWEQGLTEPNKMACRFMDEIRRDPDYYLRRLSEAARPKNRLTPRQKSV